MEFVATIADYAQDRVTQRVWAWVRNSIGNVEGLAYYRASLFGTLNEPLADLTVFSEKYHPIVLKVADWVLDEIAPEGEERWIVTRGDQRTSITSPLLEIDEFRHKLQARFDQDRKTRGRFNVKAYVVLPAVQSRGDFYTKFGGLQGIIWDETQIPGILSPLTPELRPDEFKLALSNIQGARPLNSRYAGAPPSAIVTMADAIHYLERNIACLDKEQIKVAHQVPPRAAANQGTGGNREDGSACDESGEPTCPLSYQECPLYVPHAKPLQPCPESRLLVLPRSCWH
jgi:hypothetical protein